MRTGRCAVTSALLVALASTAGCTASGSSVAHHGSTGSPSSIATAPAPPPSSGTPQPLRVSARGAGWRLPVPLSRAVAMAYDGRVLLAGGLRPGDVSTSAVWRIDFGSGKAHRSASLPLPVHDAAGGVVGGRPTVVGGGSSSTLSDVQQEAPDGHWHVVGHLPTSRSDLSAAVVNGALVAVGGYDGVRSPRAVLATSGGRRFQPVARLPRGVRYAGVAALDGAVWVLGGEENGRELSEVYRVDPSTGRVSRAGRLPGPLGHEAVVAVGSRLLVLGGRPTPSTATDRMWWFNPSTRTWRRAGRLPYPVADAPIARTGSSAYLLGGETPSFTSRVTRISWSR